MDGWVWLAPNYWNIFMDQDGPEDGSTHLSSMTLPQHPTILYNKCKKCPSSFWPYLLRTKLWESVELHCMYPWFYCLSDTGPYHYKASIIQTQLFNSLVKISLVLTLHFNHNTQFLIAIGFYEQQHLLIQVMNAMPADSRTKIKIHNSISTSMWWILDMEMGTFRNNNETLLFNQWKYFGKSRICLKFYSRWKVNIFTAVIRLS